MLRKLSLFAILAVVAVGCSGGSDMSQSESGPNPAAPNISAMRGAKVDGSRFSSSPGSLAGSSASDTGSFNAQKAVDRSVVKGATLSVRAENLDDAEKKVQEFIRSSGGFEQTLNSSDLAGPNATINITAKVPVENFDKVIGQIEGLGTRVAKNISIEDITEAMMSWDVRLKSLRQQMADLKKQGATNIGIDQYQYQMQDLKSQIENMQTQRDAQAKTAAYSTLQLTLRQGAVPGAHQDPNWLAQAYGQSSSSAAEAFRVAATIFLWLLFMSPFYLPFVIGGWLIYRANKRRQSAPPTIHSNMAPPQQI